MLTHLTSRRLASAHERKEKKKERAAITFPKFEMQERREGDIVREQIETSNQGRHEHRPSQTDRQDGKNRKIAPTPYTFSQTEKTCILSSFSAVNSSSNV
jgi:hypothetical protein